MDIWGTFKAEVRRQNTTQEWVATQAGISPNTLKGWIAKGRQPGIIEALDIANALGVSLEYLLTGRYSYDSWLNAHRELIENLKALSPDDLGWIEASCEPAFVQRKQELQRDNHVLHDPRKHNSNLGDPKAELRPDRTIQGKNRELASKLIELEIGPESD